jgi:hypothetical protein
MRANLAPNYASADFLDGYLYRLIQEVRDEHGIEDSGLLNYYGQRIAAHLGGLAEYEQALGLHLLSAFKERPVVHAGIGVGTLASFLAVNGMRIAGVEASAKRIALAKEIRSALIRAWPEVEDRYEILGGFYPNALEGTSWPPPHSILLFTNAAFTWTTEQTDAIIRSMRQYDDVFLNLRLFGSLRPEDADRTELFDRLAADARWAERLPHIAKGEHFARFVFGR